MSNRKPSVAQFHLFALALVFMCDSATGEKLKSRNYKKYGDTMGVVLLDINWGRSWGCGEFENAQLTKLSFERAPLTNEPNSKFSSILLKSPSRLFVNPEFLSYGFVVQPGEYVLTEFAIKAARSKKDVGHIKADRETLVDGENYRGGVLRVDAGEVIYVGHFGLSCLEHPTLWRYYAEGWESFANAKDKYREEFGFLGGTEIQYRLFETEYFGPMYELPEGSAASSEDGSRETVFVPADDESGSWETGCYLQEGGPGSIVTYVPRGSGCENSDETLSIAFLDTDLPTNRSSLQVFFDRRSEHLEDSKCAVLTVVKEGETELMWEEDLTDCAARREHYVLRKMFVGQEGLHDVTYSNSDLFYSEEKKLRWTQLLKDSYLEKDRKRVYEED
ncbi:MAG: hypothetical protein ACR2RD_18135 [Woeseiaceae bacterium]